MKEYIVKVMHDPEHDVFISWSDELPGLTAEAKTVEELMEIVEDTLPWVLETLSKKEQYCTPIYQLAKFREYRV
jgi:predicted RNase H-like HicB family nuclease